MAKITDKQGLDWLENELQSLNRRTKLFILLKRELKNQGYWKNRGRGNPVKGFKAGFGSKKNVV